MPRLQTRGSHRSTPTPFLERRVSIHINKNGLAIITVIALVIASLGLTHWGTPISTAAVDYDQIRQQMIWDSISSYPGP